MTGLVELPMTLAPCLRCRAPLIIINGKAQGVIRIWQTETGLMITAHRDDCLMIEHQAPEGLLLR